MFHVNLYSQITFLRKRLKLSDILPDDEDYDKFVPPYLYGSSNDTHTYGKNSLTTCK